MSKQLFLIFLHLVSLAALRAQTSQWQPSPGHREILIWPGEIPDAQPVHGPETFDRETRELVAGRSWVYVGRVSRPTLTVYSPVAENTGAAVVVFPGGGYQILAMDLEGTEICDWLTAKGITCVLLKYRVPGNGQQPKSGPYPQSPMALEDAQRTVRLVRFHAAEWHINPHKIGVLGFSAGGHLAAAISTNFENHLYPGADAADAESCRPDFAVVLYPGHMLGRRARDLNPFIPVTSKTPPTFLLQAKDDPVDSVRNSEVYFAALKKARVAAEIHLYSHGGHAFGLRRTKFPVTAWPALVEKWLRTIKIIPQQQPSFVSATKP